MWRQTEDESLRRARKCAIIAARSMWTNLRAGVVDDDRSQDRRAIIGDLNVSIRRRDGLQDLIHTLRPQRGLDEVLCH